MRWDKRAGEPHHSPSFNITAITVQKPPSQPIIRAPRTNHRYGMITLLFIYFSRIVSIDASHGMRRMVRYPKNRNPSDTRLFKRYRLHFAPNHTESTCYCVVD